MSEKRVLVIGYGNPGRLDDGIGPILAEKLETMKLPNVTVDSDYQLNVEDASDIAKHDIVVFADAALAGSEPFFFTQLTPQPALGFSSHSVEPEVLLHMAREMFGSNTLGFALGIRGYEFNEFGESLSDKAKANLEAAIEFLVKTIKSGQFEEEGTPPPPVKSEDCA